MVLEKIEHENDIKRINKTNFRFWQRKSALF